MNVILAQPRGFCAGVVRAIEIVERALESYPHPIYVLHEIVHNPYVVNNLRNRGAIFVESLDEIPASIDMCIFSAHGVATTVVEHAKQRNLKVIDASCPLVTKVHAQAQRYAQQGLEIIIIGHAGHPEVEGTRGCINGTAVHILCRTEEVEKLQVSTPDKIAYVTQTTLSVDDTREVITALTKRFPNIKGPSLEDICYATQNRQNAVRSVAHKIDILLVVGAYNSSNSNRLKEVGKQAGLKSYLIENADNLEQNWFFKNAIIGITAGASTPEILVDDVLQKLKTFGVKRIETMLGKMEEVTFSIPKKLLKH